MAISSCSRDWSRGRHTKQAEHYFQNGEYDKAEIEYLNVLQLDSGDAQAIGRLATIYFEQGRPTRAIPYLIKSRELKPNELGLRLDLGLLYLSGGKWKEAREEATFIIGRNPDDADATLLLAEAAPKAEDIEEARRRLLALPHGSTPSPAVLLALGTLDRRRGHFKEAEEKLKRAQEQSPKSSATSSALGTLYWAKKDLPHAEEAFVAAAELAPPRSPRRLQLAQFRMQNGNRAGAKRSIEEIVKKTPDFLPGWSLLAEILMLENNFEGAENVLGKLLSKEPTHLEARLLQGRIELAKGNIAGATADFEKLLTLYPQAAPVRYQLGYAYLANGDVGRAIGSLSQAIALSPDFADAGVLLAGIYINNNDPNPAIVLLKSLIQKRPDLAQPRLLLAQAYRTQGNLDDAIATYREVEKSFQGNPQTPWLLGLILLQQNKNAAARTAFDEAVARAPEYLPAIEQLVNLDLIEKEYTAARQRVEGQIAKRPTNASLQLLLAKIFLSQQKNDEAESALRKAIDLEPESSQAYLMLARLYIGSQQQKKALKDLQEIVARKPKEAAALMLMGVIYDQEKDYAAARDNYEKLLAINPKFTAALNNLAYLYSQHFGQLEKAYEMAKRARELLPTEPNTADTLGWIVYKKHQYPWALSLLQESARNVPASLEMQYHLGMTYYMMGDEKHARVALERAMQPGADFPGKEEARKSLSILAIDANSAPADSLAELEKWVSERPEDATAPTQLARIYIHQGKLEKAAGACEAGLRANPNNLAVLLTASEVAELRHDLPKAVELAKTARKVAPEDPIVAEALGRVVYETGDFKWALSLLQESAGKQPTDAEVFYDLAQVSYRLGLVSAAETAMQRALQTETSFPHEEKARRFLELIGLVTHPAEAVAAASKVESVLQSEPTDPAALMAKAVICEQKAEGDQAKIVYQEILNRYPAFAPAAKRLANLYLDEPNGQTKAYTLVSRARDAFPEDAELAKLLGIIVYKQGDFARAASLLKESSGQRGDDAEVMYYLGMAKYRVKERTTSREALLRALDLNLRPDFAVEAKRTLAELK